MSAVEPLTDTERAVFSDNASMWEVAQALKPGITRAEFDAMWDEMQQLRRLHKLNATALYVDGEIRAEMPR